MDSREEFWTACYLEHFKKETESKSDLTSDSSAYFAKVSLEQFDKKFKKD